MSSNLQHETENFRLTSSLESGLVFLHIEIYKMNKTSIRDLQSSMTKFKEQCFQEGHDVVFATTANEKTTKFWELIEPCYKVVPLEDVGWLGSWLTKEI